MTDPREEIKRLADDLAAAHTTHTHRVRDGLSEYDLAQSCKISNEARAALHAAIDAMPLGNLTDAALEGVQAPTPSPSVKAEIVTSIDGKATGWVGECPFCRHMLHITAPPISLSQRMRDAGYTPRKRESNLWVQLHGDEEERSGASEALKPNEQRETGETP